ncbi:MAG: hypothetical protein ACXVZV_01230 [Terriglobales bacterium]
MVRTMLLGLLVFMAVTISLGQDKPISQSAATAKFTGLPVLPDCAKFAVERGDPMKGPSLLLIKTTSGCVVPWHWHTADEELMFVSGSAKVQMKDASTAVLKPASYVFLPGKHHHQFTCVASCTFFNNITGTFDIHYIDKSGKEVPPETVLKKKAPPKK